MAPTQDALYAEIDLELSWSERELPERERTKHVHRLHPYLGKFIPQLVEALLGRYVPAGGRVLDPFAGSGTTLVQSLESGRDAVGVDIAAFNCLLMEVKTRRYDLFALESELRDVVRRVEAFDGDAAAASGYVGEWYRAARSRRASRVSRADRRVRAPRRPSCRAGPRRTVGAPHNALRPRLPARPAGRALLVPQAQADLPAGRARRALPPPVRDRHARADQGVLARACARAQGRGAPRRRARGPVRRPVRRAL